MDQKVTEEMTLCCLSFVACGHKLCVCVCFSPMCGWTLQAGASKSFSSIYQTVRMTHRGFVDEALVLTVTGRTSHSCHTSNMTRNQQRRVTHWTGGTNNQAGDKHATTMLALLLGGAKSYMLMFTVKL